MSIVAANNITQLITKDIEHDVEPGVSVIYTMLGYTVQTKAVSRINDSFLPNEKIVIRLRSNLKYLNELAEPIKVDLRLMFGKKVIGTTSFLLEVSCVFVCFLFFLSSYIPPLSMQFSFVKNYS